MSYLHVMSLDHYFQRNAKENLYHGIIFMFVFFWPGHFWSVQTLLRAYVARERLYISLEQLDHLIRAIKTYIMRVHA